jgi:hypothetical protein
MTNHLEFYETPLGVVRALLDNSPVGQRSVFEPCAGDLAIARLLPDCLTNDIDKRRPTSLHLDATKPETWAGIPRRDWVVTNPPFSKAELILPLAFEWAEVGVAFLLRLTFLEPCNGRAAWLREHEFNFAKMLIFNPRPSFTKNRKTDSVTAAWMIWTKEEQPGTWIKYITDWKGVGHE